MFLIRESNPAIMCLPPVTLLELFSDILTLPPRPVETVLIEGAETLPIRFKNLSEKLCIQLKLVPMVPESIVRFEIGVILVEILANNIVLQRPVSVSVVLTLAKAPEFRFAATMPFRLLILIDADSGVT